MKEVAIFSGCRGLRGSPSGPKGRFQHLLEGGAASRQPSAVLLPWKCLNFSPSSTTGRIKAAPPAGRQDTITDHPGFSSLVHLGGVTEAAEDNSSLWPDTLPLSKDGDSQGALNKYSALSFLSQCPRPVTRAIWVEWHVSEGSDICSAAPSTGDTGTFMHTREDGLSLLLPLEPWESNCRLLLHSNRDPHYSGDRTNRCPSFSVQREWLAGAHRPHDPALETSKIRPGTWDANTRQTRSNWWIKHCVWELPLFGCQGGSKAVVGRQVPGGYGKDGVQQQSTMSNRKKQNGQVDQARNSEV